ncbi:hypothetical protein [Streptomyces fradiae]|uniref:hypothetical protein n=1 Tax=Streptomyces fradiae TaxID=1906 RepID=UPI0035BE12AF
MTTGMPERRKLGIGLVAALATATAAAAVVVLWPGENAASPGSDACFSILSKLEVEASGGITSCGNALEKAMTGREAGHKPPKGKPQRLPEKSSQALELVITTYTERTEKGETVPVPSEIKKNLANALSYYAGDTYEILAGQVDYSDSQHSTTPNDIDIDTPAMSDFLDALADDGDAFRIIREALFGKIESELDTLDEQDFLSEPKAEPGKAFIDSALGAAISSGTVAGDLRGARLNALTKQYGNNKSAAEKALLEDYESYGFPRLRKLFEDRSAALGSTETAAGRQRLDSLLSKAAEAYSRGTGFEDRV